MSPDTTDTAPAADAVIPGPPAAPRPNEAESQRQQQPVAPVQLGDAGMAGQSSGGAAAAAAAGEEEDAPPRAETETPDAATSNRPRTATSTAEIDSTIQRPGSVTINVKGAFIVDQESATPANGRGSPDHNHSRDIRLPYHTAVVSHIAVDVRHPFTPLFLPAVL